MADERGLLVWLVNGVLMVALLEAAWLLRRAARAGQPAGPLLANLGAGLALMLALRLVLADLAWPWVAACLAGAGLAHVLDLRARWPRLGATAPPAPPAPATVTRPAALAPARGSPPTSRQDLTTP